ncbi:MAG: lipocalin family protein [Elusimicrobia bacterium]|nr:lipocalin family protein [Elusimicrobiota bacterium]
MKALLLAAAVWAASAPPKTVGSMDLAKYMGTWYEVAVLPNAPQAGCSDTVVHYRLRDGGGFDLLNTCYKGAKYKPYNGVAKPTEPGSTVKFFARFFLFFGSDYWVIDLDPEYRWAAVGNPARDRLWVISRTPTLEPAVYDAVVARAKAQGYPVEKLAKTVHSGRMPPADPWAD